MNGKIKLLIGGSPCTHWSIAQTKNRETEPSGIGWELLRNYVVALKKYQPDYFLYENNKSMAPAIRAQITRELGVEPVLINSALVSAQNRQRLYWVGKRNPDGTYSQVDVEQPEDRGIILRDILEQTTCEKGYILKPPGKPLTEREMEYMVRETSGGRNHFDFDYHHDATTEKSQCVTANTHRGVPYNVLLEPVNTTEAGKAQCLRATYYKDGIRNMVGNTVDRKTCVAEPVRIGTIESEAKNADFDSQQYRVYSLDGKSVTLCGRGGGVGAKTGLYADPVRVGDMPNAEGEIRGGQAHRVYDADGKEVTLTARPNGGGVDGPLYAVQTEPIRVCNINGGGQGNRIYSTDAKSCAIKAQGGGLGGHGQGLYAIPTGMAWRGHARNGNPSSFEIRCDQKANAVIVGHQSRLVIEDAAIFQNPHGFNKGGVKYEKSPTLTANGDWPHNNFLIEAADGKTYPVYEVRSGIITIKGKQYPIKLADGFYIIRKLTVTECKRLQTVPDSYIFPVSDTQAYKMLGNGWTVDVIAHIMGHFDGIREKPVEVLSMYDGMSCGRIALDKLGAEVIRYHATEIDKYAIQTTMANYPDTVQLGDAFQVLADDWDGGGLISEPERAVAV